MDLSKEQGLLIKKFINKKLNIDLEVRDLADRIENFFGDETAEVYDAVIDEYAKQLKENY